jgi:hypothetical protein
MGRQRSRNIYGERPLTAASRSLEDDYPEAKANMTAIEEVKNARADLLRHALADDWVQGKMGWKTIKGDKMRTGDETTSLPIRSSTSQMHDELEATIKSYGGRDHSKTIARLITEGRKRAAGVNNISADRLAPRIEDRIFRTPRGDALELQDGPISSTSSHKAVHAMNPLQKLRQRIGPNLRESQVRAGPRRRHQKRTNGVESPCVGSRAKFVMPESPGSPVHQSSSPLGAVVSPGVRTGERPAYSGFARDKFTAASKSRQNEKDNIMSSLFGAEDNKGKQTDFDGATESSPHHAKARGVKFGEAVRKDGHRHTRLSLAGKGGSPLSPLLAATALTSPHLLPMVAKGGRRASGHGVTPMGHMHHTWKIEDENDPNVYSGGQNQEWHQQVMRLRSVITQGQAINWKMISPFTNLERIILANSKWRQKDAIIDTHDKVVLEGMPYKAHNAINNPGALRALGQAVLHADPLMRTAGLAALGDKNNFGNASCLAQVVPRLTDPDTRVKAAALRGVEQIAKPGNQKQYIEVEIEVFAATNLPKKDRYGACDGYVILTLKHPGLPDAEVGRTAIKWKDLNPRWRQKFFFEIKEPDVDVIEFSVWDEDGETDDICGICSFFVNDIEFDEATGAKPQISRTLQILDQKTDEPIRGWNAVSLKNDGVLSKLQIKARYTAYMRPKDMINSFIELLYDEDSATRTCALNTVAAFCTDSNIHILEAVANMLEDNDASIRKQASLKLQELAWINDPHVIQLVAQRMDHGDPQIRHVAVETLRRVSSKGNPFAIAQVAKRLESHVSVIRGLVTEAMPEVADTGDMTAVQEICSRFQHKLSEVREAAIRAFASIAPKGDHDMVSIIGPMISDEDQSCRMAAVQSISIICNVGPLGDPTVLERARKILQTRIDFNNGNGDPNRVVLDAVKKAISTLTMEAPWIYGCDPAKGGAFNAILPASWVRITRDRGVFTELVDPMPLDSKFNTTLPYRPPTPPWEPKAMQKASLKRTIAQANQDLKIYTNSIAQLEDEAEVRDLSPSEESELDSLREKEERARAVIEKAEAEMKELVGDVEVQPPNTTKLGFEIKIKIGHGEHCQHHSCERSACF